METLKKYRLPIILGIIILVLGITVLVVTSILNNPDRDVPSDSSAIFEASIESDEKALNDRFGIYKYLPIESTDPSFKISYDLSFDEEKNDYIFRIVLDAFSAAAREDAVKTLLSSDFGEFDPLDYEIYIKNYVNPLANLSLDSSFSNLPGNFSVKETKILSDSVRVTTLTHTLYDGNTNTYRFVEKKSGDSWTAAASPALIYSYSDLSDFSHALIKEINSI